MENPYKKWDALGVITTILGNIHIGHMGSPYKWPK